MRQVHEGGVQFHGRKEMHDLVIVDGRARGIIVRDLVTGQLERHMADAVVLATGGYGRIFFLSTNAFNSNCTAIWRAHKRGAVFGNPCYTQIHPTCIPVSGDTQSKLTLMSESLRNDGRVWAPKNKGDGLKAPSEIPDSERDYFLERKYPSFGNLVPRDVASRNAKTVCDEGRGVGASGRAVYLDFRDAIKRDGEAKIRDRYSNLFQMYDEITGEDPYKVPMRIYPAVHYTMGGLWVDYDLMSNVPGLFVVGEANFSDHGANRLGASALMQGLADGYFVLPFTIGDYLAQAPLKALNDSAPEFAEAENATRERIQQLLNVGKKGKRTVMEFYRELGLVIWNNVGMARSDASCKDAIKKITALRSEFWENLKLTGVNEEFNKSLELATRVADFMELGELMARDALHRTESCGGHFREESQTEEGEAKRDDENFSYVAAWEWKGAGKEPVLHKEELKFENVKVAQRSYK
jgi:succinate dehydrogenase / fumarate reductase flavoprotein subunit